MSSLEKESRAFKVDIFLGFREQYTDTIHSIDEAYKIIQSFCDKRGLCVTVTPTTFIYTNGNEPGCIIGLINYPRFEAHFGDIWRTAKQLAEIMMHEFGQIRVTMQSTDTVLMLENTYLK